MKQSSRPLPDRRQILQACGAAAATLGLAKVAAADPQEPAGIRPDGTILFQGDSITDAGRERDLAKLPADNLQIGLGNGYAWLAASQLLIERPNDRLRIINRGISGDTLAQLAARWQVDCLDLKPDVLSILVGANDYGVWRDNRNVSIEALAADFEERYIELIRQTRHSLPSVRIVLLEPFMLRAGKVGDDWLPDFKIFRPAVARVAAKTNAEFVACQTMYDEAAKIAPAERWASDGVHPTSDGAALLAGEWLRAVRS